MEKYNYAGLDFLGLLTITFIVLKLTGVIDWSWWWVLAPVWIPFVITIMILAIIVFTVNNKIKKEYGK